MAELRTWQQREFLPADDKVGAIVSLGVNRGVQEKLCGHCPAFVSIAVPQQKTSPKK